jgi:hypothetical protein
MRMQGCHRMEFRAWKNAVHEESNLGKVFDSTKLGKLRL